MNPMTHPIEPEELMAYLDGELSAERKAETAEHLSVCKECQEFVGQFERVSANLDTWSIEETRSAMPPAIGEALERTAPSAHRNAAVTRPWRSIFRSQWKTVAWAGALALLLASVSIPTLYRRTEPADVFYSESRVREQERPSQSSPAVVGGLLANQSSRQSQFSTKLEARDKLGVVVQEHAPPAAPVARDTNTQRSVGPMIIRTAQLAVVTKDFEKARENVESILRRHRGYLADLKVGGSTGSGRSLTGTLRVPADQLDAAIGELESLGRVETESQTGQDVTSQYVDLEARLTNSRHTEERLIDLLRNRTGKLSDVLEVEQEISRVRGEIEQIEAERKTMANQVTFATVNLTMSEDYKAQLQVVPPSTSTRLRNAAVEGYRSVVDGALSMVLFVLTTGPSLLLWGILLFLPARVAWKKLRRRVVE